MTLKNMFVNDEFRDESRLVRQALKNYIARYYVDLTSVTYNMECDEMADTEPHAMPDVSPCAASEKSSFDGGSLKSKGTPVTPRFLEKKSTSPGQRKEKDRFEENYSSALDERISHLSDTFPEYLAFLIKKNGFTNVEVYKRALVTKQSFAKIMNNPGHHPKKITALCLAVGAHLTVDETKDLLARAGYALSPCNKTDIIFSFFIENKIYDMIEIDIALEEHGEPCLIS